MLIYSSRSSQQQQNTWVEQFTIERQLLRKQIAKQIVKQMASIVGHLPTADLILVSSKGEKLPAHQCILKQRAPNFYKRYLQPVFTEESLHLQSQLLEIPVNIEYSSLEFFIRSIYTDEEIVDMGYLTSQNTLNGSSIDDDNAEGNFESQNSGNNEDSQKQDNKIQPHQNQQMSASFPSPNSPRDILSATTLKLVNNERRCLSQELYQQNEEYSIRKHSAIFPYFIKMGIEEEEEGCSTSRTYTGGCGVMSRSLPLSISNNTSRGESPHSRDISDCNTIRGRAIAARRRQSLCSSLSSLTSIDILTPTQEIAQTPHFADQNLPANKLAEDLLKMLVEEKESKDVRLLSANGEEESAHSCILWASESEFFREQISTQTGHLYIISMTRFSRTSIAFLLQFIYGGLTCLPVTVGIDNDAELLDLWELVELGAFTKIETFVKVVVLHIRAVHCHFFHRPCASCVSAVFEALPKIEREISELNKLFTDAMQWQAAHFTRIWKGRIFLHLSFHWQKHCLDFLLHSINEENVVDVLLGCEKLNLALPRVKQQIAAQQVLKLINNVEEYCMEFLTTSLDSLIQSKAFCSYGKRLALNLALLEDILPTLIHSLSPETTIRTFVSLKEFIITQLFGEKNNIRESNQKQSFYNSNLSNEQIADEWNPRFKNLCLRLIDLIEKHMFHYAYSIINSTEWPLLSIEDQNRVNEFGLFIEMKMPKIAPPRLSSASNHNYCKRSSSVGVYSNYPEKELFKNEILLDQERARSMERIKGGSNINRRMKQICGFNYSRPSSLAIQFEEENFSENDQLIPSTNNNIINTIKSENNLQQIGVSIKNDKKLDKIISSATKISEKNNETKIGKKSTNIVKNINEFEEKNENIQTNIINEKLKNLKEKVDEKIIKADEKEEDYKKEEIKIVNEGENIKEVNVERRQSAPTTTALRNRQKTHTILNVDRKNISVLINNNVSNNLEQKNVAKPHSIVRPMPKIGQASITTTELSTLTTTSTTKHSLPSTEKRERRNIKQTNVSNSNNKTGNKIETNKKQTGGVSSQQQQRILQQQKSGIKKPSTLIRK